MDEYGQVLLQMAQQIKQMADNFNAGMEGLLERVIALEHDVAHLQQDLEQGRQNT